MTSFNNYFTVGPSGTLSFKPEANLSFRGTQLPIYTNTEIDRWFVGEFFCATYTIGVEFDSNQKEMMQVTIVARPEQASYNIYGRTTIDRQLITLSATVNENYLSLIASPTTGHDGCRLSFVATYGQTMNTLTFPTSVS